MEQMEEHSLVTATRLFTAKGLLYPSFNQPGFLEGSGIMLSFSPLYKKKPAMITRRVVTGNTAISCL